MSDLNASIKIPEYPLKHNSSPHLNIRINAPAPAAACSIPEATLRAYAALIGYEGPDDPLAKATEIISELDQNIRNHGYFTALLATLPTRILVPSTVPGLEYTHYNIFRTTNHKTANGARLNTIDRAEAGSGTFATVYKSVDDHVCKFITNVNEGPAEFEKKMRGIFLEAFIQLVLAMDPVKGSSVCRIEGMYRTPDKLIKKPGEMKEYTVHTVVIQLEYITESLANKLDSTLTFPDLALMMKSIHEPLMYFREKYNFHHRDLHNGNIMLKDGKIKIIDFGESCITYCGKTFSLRREGRIQVCESADMLILVGSLYEYSKLNDAVKNKLLDLLGKMRADYDAINELIKLGMKPKNAKGDSSIFHKFYHYILLYSPEGKLFLENYDKEFIVKLNELLPAKGGYRKRSNTKRRRQTHRKTVRR